MQYDFSKLKDWSLFYAIIKVFFEFMHSIIFYRNVYVTGNENLPKNKPIIMVANHQNALMDALALDFIKKPWQIFFLARADIFKKPLQRRLLFFLKILPVFRLRDGKESLKFNELTFQKATELLERKNILTIYPEASHLGMRRLRTIQKGVMRIAFTAEQKNNFNLGLTIVPVGINYSNYFSFRSTLSINIGKPISVADYKELFEQNEHDAQMALRDRIAHDISELIIDIRNEKFYEMYEMAREIYDKPMAKKLDIGKLNFLNKIYVDKKTIAAIDEYDEEHLTELENFNKIILDYKQHLASLSMRDWVLEKKPSKLNTYIQTFVLLLAFPIFVFGFVNNIIPHSIPFRITRKIKDKNFHSSVRFVLYSVLYPLFYTLVFCLIWAFTDIFWLKWAYTFLMIPTGIFAFHYLIWSIKNIAKWRYILLSDNDLLKNAISLRAKIIEKLNKITDDYLRKKRLKAHLQD